MSISTRREQMATHRLQRAAAEVAVVLEGWGWTPAWAALLPPVAARILWEYPEERTLTARSFVNLCGFKQGTIPSQHESKVEHIVFINIH